MQATANFVSAVDYTAITALSAYIAWSTRQHLPTRAIFQGAIGCTLFLMSCATHHVGHALDAPWTPWATTACAIFSSLGGVLIFTLKADISRALKELVHGATFDRLTGLYRRQAAQQKVQALLKTLSSEITIIFIDIDNFKAINDTQGHAVGDTVIQEIAKIMSGASRKNDIPARWGGEEFILFLPACDFKNGLQIADQIRLKVEQTQQTTISAGVCFLRPGQSLESGIKRADEALYRAKHSGKNRVCSCLDGGKDCAR